MDIQRICIVGAGAVGGLIGARLAAAGDGISILARGGTLAALKAHGLRLREPDAPERTLSVRASDDPAALGRFDLVVLAVKAPALPAVAEAAAALLAPGGVLLPAMNGVPWWFTQGEGAPLAGRFLESVDPGGGLARTLPVDRVIGSVVHWAGSCPAPGVVRRHFGNRLILGEPGGQDSERLRAVAAMLRRAGFDVEETPAIRRELWFKLWGNMTMNPVSAITGATADRILDDPLVAGFCEDCMREAAAIGARIGCAIDQSPAERNAVTRRLGAFRTSMLQDVDAGRPVELDALVGAVAEIGRLVDVPAPRIDALLGLARLHARVRGLHG